MDCTGSMGSYIEAVKNNISNLRDRLHEEYRNCDVVFSFVRYTDFDQPDSTKTTYLPFTRYKHDNFVNVSEITLGA